MTTTALSVENPTLLDVAKATAPDGSIFQVVQSLAKKTPLLEDMTFIQGNLPTGHRIAQQTALPSLGWRGYNEGVAPSKGKNDTFDETMGLLEGQSVCDVKLAELNGNAAAFRAAKDNDFLAAFRNEIESGIFYHSTATTPKKIKGLSPRLNTISGHPYANQIVDSQIAASGSDQASIWGIVWAPRSVYAIYPKGSVGGLESHDMGVRMVDDAAGNQFRAYVTVWDWQLGLAVEDARQVVRVANIDTSAVAATGKLLIEDWIKAYYRLYDPNAGRLVWYVNRTVASYAALQAQDTVKNSTLSIENIGGKPVTMFMGAPVRISDALTSAEDIIS